MFVLGVWFAAIRLLAAFNCIQLEGHVLAGYTALAHVYMGVLGCLWWHNRHPEPNWLKQPWQWHLFWAMNCVEVFSAIISRM